MKKEKMYCLYNQYGEPLYNTLSYYRYIVETEWLKNWDKKCEKWRYWYRQGWRIKKVYVSIEIINPNR